MTEVIISKDFIGESTDTKPTDVPDGSIFYEVDTKKKYVMYCGNWMEM